MAKVTSVETVASFCPTYDSITVASHPELPVKVRRGTFKKGDFVLFEDAVPRHVYKSHFFYGKAYKPSEWAIDKPVIGQVVETLSESEFWGFTRE